MAGFGVVAPLVLYPDRTIERAGVTYINLKDNEPGWIVPHFRYQNFLNPNAVSLTSCNVAEKCIGISQQVIKKVGYLREDLSYLYACVDYCLKARTNGSSTFHVGYTSVISDLPQWLNICEKYQPTHILELAEIEEKDRKILYDCWNGIKI